MNGVFADIPPLAATTRVTVVIPARDEERDIPRTLAALAAQRRPGGSALPRGLYDIIVFANECRDGTAEVARAAAATSFVHGTVHVVEGGLPPGAAHVGSARKLVMDAAAIRFARAGALRGIIASTDADTIVDAHWIAATLAEAHAVDAVTGRIMLGADERGALEPQTRALYLREVAYRRLVGELAALRDPVPHDPLPRHAQHYGASFAVTADAYRRAGGVPPQPALEDLAFYHALERIDARIRHSMHVRVTTSARTLARVEGGFATFLSDLHARGQRRGEFYVEDPTFTLARLDARAALRRVWSGAGAPGDVDCIATVYGISQDRFRRLFDRHDAFGANAQRLDAWAEPLFRTSSFVPLERALSVLRCAFVSANVTRPARTTTASGAG